jgi:hypothetical protein
VVAVPWTVTLDPQQLTVLVDPDTTLADPNRANNRAVAILPVDFGVQIHVQYRAPDENCPGDSLQVSALVSNTGLLSADSVRVDFVGVAPTGPIGTTVIEHLPAKTYCAVPVATDVHLVRLQLGDTIVDAIVDPEDQWPEWDESNNVSTATRWADCSGGGNVDLVVLGVEFHLHSVAPGTVLGDIEVHGWSQGEIVPSALCRLTIEGIPICNDIVLTRIFEGYLFGTCSSSWVIPEPAGQEHHVMACIDPYHLIPEYNEYNNCGNFLVEVTGVPTPVSLTDFKATSDVEGVALRWRSLDVPRRQAVERRVVGSDTWHRLHILDIQPRNADEYTTVEYLDRSASPDVSYEYRIVGLDPEGNEWVLGDLTVRFSPALPDRLVVHPASPNPFNPSTSIRFSIPHAQHVEVRILDSAGRLVEQLCNAELGAGRHDLTWHGTDARGAVVPSGIYFCSVRAASGQQTRKLVLIK